MAATVLPAAADHYARQAALAESTAAALARMWAQSVDPQNITRSWTAVLADALGLLLAGQMAAASLADRYVDAVWSDLGNRPADPAGRVAIRAFTTASDGRPLVSLLTQPAFAALARIAAGGTTTEGMTAGMVSVTRLAGTQVADAGRAAESVAITARPRIGGYVRMVQPPACSRCVILAGRFYRWSAGFARHPMCDCRHIPAAEDASGDLTTDPSAYFKSLPAAEQDRYFTKTGAQAIRDGADMAKVVNARRGMDTAARVTTEGATSARQVRLMPEAIYRQASWDRAEAVRLLRVHGYLL